jgi:2-isopropylmalate synthase
VELRNEHGEVLCDAAIGDGPVDAVFKAIERIVGVAATLDDYQVRSVSEGKDAQGEVLVAIQCEGRLYHGKAVSTDIVEGSSQAFLKALNKALAKKKERQPS